MIAPEVEVAAGILTQSDGRVLLGQRPASKVYAGFWEFPGGKVEPGETTRGALDRELHEELGVDVKTAYPWLTQTFSYPHATVRLQFFRVTEWAGEPRAKEHQGLAWQHPSGFSLEPMLPANTPILRALALPDEYAITNVAITGESVFLRALDERLAAGLRLVELREPDLARHELATIGREIVARAHRVGARVLLAGEEALAGSIGADGVHLPAEALARAGHRPAFAIVAASCHSTEALQRAARLGLDFVTAGPVVRGRSPALGWDGFARLADGCSLPVFAVGGLERDDLETAWRHGAHGIALRAGAWG